MNPTVKDILETYLKENGFDGLFCPDVPCGCLIDDLNPCEESMENCHAGYREDVPDSNTCECETDQPHWHICEIAQGKKIKSAEKKADLCKCGHEEKLHNSVTGECLLCNPNGIMCPCQKFEPVEKSCENCGASEHKCEYWCVRFSAWQPREKQEKSCIQKLMPLLGAIVGAQSPDNLRAITELAKLEKEQEEK